MARNPDAPNWGMKKTNTIKNPVGRLAIMTDDAYNKFAKDIDSSKDRTMMMAVSDEFQREGEEKKATVRQNSVRTRLYHQYRRRQAIG